MAAEIEVEDVVTRARAVLFAVSLAMSFVTQPAQSAVRVLIVSGLGGEQGYEQKFQTQAKAVASAASRSGAALKDIVVITRRAGAAHGARSRAEEVCFRREER